METAVDLRIHGRLRYFLNLDLSTCLYELAKQFLYDSIIDRNHFILQYNPTGIENIIASPTENINLNNLQALH